MKIIIKSIENNKRKKTKNEVHDNFNLINICPDTGGNHIRNIIMWINFYVNILFSCVT